MTIMESDPMMAITTRSSIRVNAGRRYIVVSIADIAMHYWVSFLRASKITLNPSGSFAWHFLYFIPHPHGHGSFLPICGLPLRIGFTGCLAARRAWTSSEEIAENIL